MYWSESHPTIHRTRMALLEEQRERADDERLRRPRQSQIDRPQADCARRISDLDTAKASADILAEPVGYGTLTSEEM